MDQVEADRIARAPALWPALLACALAAAWVDFGTIHRLHHSDSILYPLISLWRWTPFYWGQDRFGMLVPLLAKPLTNPLANLLFQDYLNIFSGLAAFVLLARYVLRDASYPIVGLLAAAAFLGLVPSLYQAMYFIDACYGVWLSLGLAGLLAIERRRGPVRVAIALLLIALAHWVNFATAAVLGPLVIARALTMETRRLGGWEAATGLALLALGAVSGRALTGLVSVPEPTPLGASTWYGWPSAWQGLLARQWESLSPPRLPAALAVAGLLGLAWLARPETRRRAAPAWKAASALVLAATVLWLYTGTREWTRRNGYAYRYLMPSTFYLQLSLLTIGLAPAVDLASPRVRRALFAGVVLALFAGATWSFGLPSPSGVRSDVDRMWGELTDDLIASRCTHLAGDYQRVWPAAFHASLVLHERGEGRVLWAVTGRSESTGPLWVTVPHERVRVGVPLGDELEANARLRQFGFPSLIRHERRPTLDVYRFQDVPGPAGIQER